MKYGETVESTIKNLDPSLTLEVVYIPVEESVKAMENGSIDWLYLVSIGEHYIVDAGDEILVKTDTYLQAVPLQLEEKPNISLNSSGQKFIYYQDYVSYLNGPDREYNSEDIVFVGYGIDDPNYSCLLYTSPSPRDSGKSRMPSSA